MQVRLAWVTPQMRFANIGQVAVAARSASAVLVFLHYEGTEGSDWPTLTLPLDQNALVRAASDGATGPVVVVLHTGAPVVMPWAEQADAILQMWYPGQEGAEATVALLLGEANPGGKLPVTFPRSEEDTPVSTPTRYPGVEGRQTYDEGIFVGYRWYDEHSIEPLFPFGHGLSYTTFAYSDLAARPAGEGFEVSFTVRNTGNQRGAEVAQVYLGSPEEAPVPMAKQHLAGFHRVELEPGEEVRLTTFIGARELSYWSIEQHGWRVVDGPRPLYVGSSSRDIRLRGEIGPGGE